MDTLATPDEKHDRDRRRPVRRRWLVFGATLVLAGLVIGLFERAGPRRGRRDPAGLLPRQPHLQPHVAVDVEKAHRVSASSHAAFGQGPSQIGSAAEGWPGR